MKNELSTGEAMYLFALYAGLLVSLHLRDGWGLALFAILLVVKQLGRIRVTIERSQR